MSLKALIEDIAKTAVMTDASDLQGLTLLLENLEKLRDDANSEDLQPLAEVANSAAELVEQLILRQAEDADATINAVRKSIEQIQDAIDSGLQANAGEPQPDNNDGSELEDVDEELLSAWVSNCESALSDLESQVVELESAEDTDELVAEVRRGIHTLKGEAGVLSLHNAQKLCHEAESGIDRCLESKQRFPVDEILGLIDWLKGYVAILANDPRAPAPEFESLFASLEEIGINASGETASAQTIDNSRQDDSDSSIDITEVETSQEEPQQEEIPQAGSNEPVEFPPEVSEESNLQDFLCEGREHIASAEEALLALEQDFEDAELINTVFRAFHTIKGVAGFMNLQPIVELAHNAEYLLDEARNGSVTLSSAYVDVILSSCDMLCQLFGALEGGQPPTKGQLTALVERLIRAVAGDLGSPATDQQSAPAGSFAPLGELLVAMEIVSVDQVEQALRRQAEGASKLRDLLVEASLTDIGALEDAIVNPENSCGILVCEMLVDLGFATKEALAAAISAKKNSDKRLGQLLGISPADLAPALREQRRQQCDNAPQQSTPVEISAPKPTSTPEPAQSTSPAATPTPVASASATAAPAPSMKNTAQQAKQRADQTVKVNMTRMDGLVDMVGELVIAQLMVIQDPAVENIIEEKLQRNLTHVSKIIRDLQEVSMSLRMVTLKATFQKMARLVRDVAKKAGKSVKLHIEGEDTELDRNVVDEIADPLVHMIRNACDHGIETPEKRRAAGKQETGNLTLRAFHQGGSIVIEIEDDGQGLNRDKILKKAIEKGIYSPDREVSDIPDSEIYNLVFLPGFTTSEKVTDISGRGVGMDVVRRNIEALRGKTEIRSTPGQGSTFSMRLPLTMAIIDGMIVRVGSQRYVIPTLSIEQSFQPTQDQLNTVVGRGELVSIRGSLLPVYRLNRVFKLNEGIDDPTESLLIVLESNHSRCCLLVDEIIGQQQVVIKSLGQGMTKVRGVSGGAILGDGRVALILDVHGLVDEATKMAESDWASAAITIMETKNDYTTDSNRQLVNRCA